MSSPKRLYLVLSSLGLETGELVGFKVISEELYAGAEAGIYALPSHLSVLARDLISKMLVVDPMKRITIPQIREHAWFKTRLPRYLAVPPPDTSQAKKTSLWRYFRRTDKNQLAESLCNTIQDEATVSYYLLADNHFLPTHGYLGGDFQETVDCLHTNSSGMAAPHRQPGYMEQQGISPRAHFPASERKWALGLQCRYFPGFADSKGMLNNEPAIAETEGADKKPLVVKFEMQIYKTREDKYLLDLQRVTGPQLLFLDLCASFLTQLRVLLKMEGSGRGSSADVVLQNYKLGKTLGIGSFGKVKIAEHLLTGHKVAIKILNRRKVKSMEMEEKVRREIKILRLFMHPHIIRLYEVIETHSDIFVVMEYVKSGELFDYIVEKGRLQEVEARRFFQQIISGVEYCHRNMVAHRDLKPENLLLDSKCNVKIADFGLSNVMRDGHFLKTSCGSPNYAAPEVISGKLYAGPEVDVWSCGVILYALLCGIYTLPSHLSALARDLIPKMLVVDPMKRITIPQIREHAWFKIRLPRYLAVPPPDTSQQAKKIDEDILLEVTKMGFDKNQLVESLHNRIQNEATVSYYLLVDNHFRTTSGYLGGDFQETMDYLNTNSSGMAAPHRQPGYMEQQGMINPRAPHSPASERKWALGLQSRAHPREIMTEVLKALQELNISWKQIGHYNMKCRYFPGFADSQAAIETEGADKELLVVKFEMQLYKTKEDKYLLDLQRVSGPQLLFLDLCAAFLAQLRVL
ncbi:hypothetical protein ZIOFF_011952 [Zingiber officinale]|uniref:non-specific serine/threonine protein kinase n=1 Tax=Zingiber officinale TaxID=94328 RepID=A0A8J5HL34_ZINOF|nr:hypothetical protein ZIOFF_011952 [Zingiber officinale]